MILVLNIYSEKNLIEYSISTSFNSPKIKKIQAITQACRALRPSALGELVVMALKILTRTRNNVINRAIRP